MLLSSLLITLGLGLAGAAPTTAPADECTTNADCSADTYCLRAAVEEPYRCLTTEQFTAKMPQSSDARGEEDECTTPDDCTEGKYCVRPSVDASYQCLTVKEIQKSMPKPAKHTDKRH